jgi:DNA repair protein RadC
MPEAFGPRKPLFGPYSYRVKQNYNGDTLLAVYVGSKRIAHMDAYWMYSMRSVEDREEEVKQRGRGVSCASDLRALGAEGKYPNVLSVSHAFITDDAHKGKGVGRAMYEAMMAEGFAVRESRTGGKPGPMFFIPDECKGVGNTSAEARRVWASLARDYPSAGTSIRVDAPPMIGSRAPRVNPSATAPRAGGRPRVEGRMATRPSALRAFREALAATGMRSNPAAKSATRRVKSDTLPDALLEMSRRFLLVDPKDVTDEDLVAVLLAGAVEGDPSAAATELLVDVQGNLARVARAEGFARRAGFSALAQARMSAAAELVKRAERRASVEGLGEKVTGPAEAERIARAYIGGPREQVGALFFDSQLRLLGFRLLSMGGQTMTVADPREVVISALEMRATAVILVHNHPSGVPSPSGPDDTTTTRLKEILRLLGMTLADHIILGKKDATYSYAMSARLNPRRSNPRGDTALRTDPELWEEVKASVLAGAKGGRPGQWSARKAQLAVAIYKQEGGGYVGPKSPANSLARWTRQKWRTKSGRPSLETGERYLPAASIAALTPAEYAATTRAKRAGMKQGQQFVPQPEKVMQKVRPYRRRNPNYENLRISRGVLYSPEGNIRVKQIGKGAFTTAYVEVDAPTPRVFLVASDEVVDKELLAAAHDEAPQNPHLPRVEKFGYTSDDQTVYVMPLYRAPLRKADSPEGWRDFSLLKKCREQAWSEVSKSARGLGAMTHRGYDVNEATLACAEASGVRPAVLEALRALVDTASNYGASQVFEFAARNLATDAEGNLVLLDPLFDMERLERQRREAAKKRAAARW